MSLPWDMSPQLQEEDEYNESDIDHEPFTLVMNTKVIGPDRFYLSPLTEVRVRVTWDHSFEQLMMHLIANSESEDSRFYPYIEYNGNVVTRYLLLSHLIPMELSPEGVCHSPDLVLVFDFIDDPVRSMRDFKRLREQGEFLRIKIIGDISSNLDYQFNYGMKSTIAGIKTEMKNTLRIPYEDMVISYKGEEASDEETILNVIGLDVPPTKLICLHLKVRSDPIVVHDNNNEAYIKRSPNKLTEFYTISTDEGIVELSSMDCILHPEGFLLVNQNAQEAIKNELKLSELGSSSNGPASTPDPQTAPESMHPVLTNLGRNPETQTNLSAAQQILPEQGPGGNIRFEGEIADVIPNVPNRVNESVAQLLIREINLHVDDLAQVFVRLALATALIGPQRAFYLLQPPLIYFLLVPTISSWLFFYGEVISDWIDQKILENANRERIDFTIAKLTSQVFRLAFALTTWVSLVISRLFKLILSLVHFDRTDVRNNLSIFGRLKITVFSVAEFLLVLIASVFPFLGNDTEKYFEDQPHVERQKMQKAILKILNSGLKTEDIEVALGFRELEMTPEKLLSPDISARDFSKLLTIYEKSLAIVT